jgi:hypothetical protein
MKWLALCCAALLAGCANSPSSTSPPRNEAQSRIEAQILAQANDKCAQEGKVALVTGFTPATTYGCVSADDPIYKAQQEALKRAK